MLFRVLLFFYSVNWLALHQVHVVDVVYLLLASFGIITYLWSHCIFTDALLLLFDRLNQTWRTRHIILMLQIVFRWYFEIWLKFEVWRKFSIDLTINWAIAWNFRNIWVSYLWVFVLPLGDKDLMRPIHLILARVVRDEVINQVPTHCRVILIIGQIRLRLYLIYVLFVCV